MTRFTAKNCMFFSLVVFCIGVVRTVPAGGEKYEEWLTPRLGRSDDKNAENVDRLVEEIEDFILNAIARDGGVIQANENDTSNNFLDVREIHWQESVPNTAGEQPKRSPTLHASDDENQNFPYFPRPGRNQRAVVRRVEPSNVRPRIRRDAHHLWSHFFNLPPRLRTGHESLAR